MHITDIMPTKTFHSAILRADGLNLVMMNPARTMPAAWNPIPMVPAIPNKFRLNVSRHDLSVFLLPVVKLATADDFLYCVSIYLAMKTQ